MVSILLMFQNFRGAMLMENNYDKALNNVKNTIQFRINTANEFKEPIPEPKGRRLIFA